MMMRDDDGLNPSKPENLRLEFRTSSELHYVFWSLSSEENNAVFFFNKLLIQEDLAQIRRKIMIQRRTEIRVNSKSRQQK